MERSEATQILLTETKCVFMYISTLRVSLELVQPFSSGGKEKPL